jgi:hypothetical protein
MQLRSPAVHELQRATCVAYRPELKCIIVFNKTNRIAHARTAYYISEVGNARAYGEGQTFACKITTLLINQEVLCRRHLVCGFK